MSDTHPTETALDSFDNRIPAEDREAFVASRPYEDAIWDWEWVSRNGGKLSDGWRFVYACEDYGEACPDAIGEMPVSRGPDGHPGECPDCGGRVYRLARAWDVALSAPGERPTEATSKGAAA
ncbi:hypothetical protein [Methylorubrum aminovorans]|uniref:hypothetical protein n=1 Tax=Methylorubrum aminovorans TaxID=269069 RepID=UPI003C2AF16C